MTVVVAAMFTMTVVMATPAGRLTFTRRPTTLACVRTACAVGLTVSAWRLATVALGLTATSAH
jgi:hypothetical protein